MFGVDRKKISQHSVDVLVAALLLGALVFLAIEVLKPVG